MVSWLRIPHFLTPSLLVVLAAFPLPATAEVPSWIDGEDSRYPLWVSEDVAVPEGELRWELLHPGQAELIEWALGSVERKRHGEADRSTESDENCQLYTDLNRWYTKAGRAKRSPTEYRSEAYAIYSGTLVASKQGFFRGMPGTLFEFAPDSAIKAAEALSPPSLLVHFPYAEIRIGDDYLCTSTYRFQDRPTVGARLVLVLEEPPDENLVVAPQDHNLFYENPDGTVSFPKDFRIHNRSLSDVVSALSTGNPQ